MFSKKIDLKIKYQGSYYKLRNIEDNFNTILKTIREYLRLTDPTIKFIDKDNDKVIMRNQSDVNEALKTANNYKITKEPYQIVLYVYERNYKTYTSYHTEKKFKKFRPNHHRSHKSNFKKRERIRSTYSERQQEKENGDDNSNDRYYRSRSRDHHERRHPRDDNYQRNKKRNYHRYDNNELRKQNLDQQIINYKNIDDFLDKKEQKMEEENDLIQLKFYKNKVESEKQQKNKNPDIQQQRAKDMNEQGEDTKEYGKITKGAY